MRRGQTRRAEPAGGGYTKAALLEAAQISAKTFDGIRKAARVSGPSHGGLNHVFSREDVLRLIAKARSGSFTERGGPAADGWERLLAGEGADGDGGAEEAD